MKKYLAVLLLVIALASPSICHSQNLLKGSWNMMLFFGGKDISRTESHPFYMFCIGAKNNQGLFSANNCTDSLWRGFHIFGDQDPIGKVYFDSGSNTISGSFIIDDHSGNFRSDVIRIIKGTMSKDYNTIVAFARWGAGIPIFIEFTRIQ